MQMTPSPSSGHSGSGRRSHSGSHSGSGSGSGKEDEVREISAAQAVAPLPHEMTREVSDIGSSRRRRSGVGSLLNFMEKYNLSRQDQKRKAVMDLSSTVNAADIARIEEYINSQNRNVTKEVIVLVIKKTRYLLAFCLWIFIGAVFYALHENMGWSLGIYQSLSVGFSLGWVLPPDVVVVHSRDSDVIISKIFTMCHNVVGVLFSGLAVIYIANDLLHRKKNWTFQRALRKKIDEKTADNWLWGNIMGCTLYHLPKIRVFIVFFLVAAAGTMWCYFSFNHLQEWTFPSACVFSFSTLSSAGYRTIPDSSDPFQFVICAIYAAVGVPLMTISLGLFIGRLFFNHDEVKLFEQMAEDVSSKELESLKLFCDKQEQSQIDNLEFAILIALRIGAVAPEMIAKIKERFDVLDRNHEHRLAYEDIIVGGGGSDIKPQYERTNSFLKSSFSLRQLLALKTTSTSTNSTEHTLLKSNKVLPSSSPGPRPRGLSFESNGVALVRARSNSEDGNNIEYIQARVRSESGDEIYSPWVKASPDLRADDRRNLHKNSVVSEGSDEEQLYTETNGYKSGIRGRAQSDVSEFGADYPPRRSMRHSFTLTEDEALQLTRRDSGMKWVRSSPRSSLRKTQVLTEDEAVHFSASNGDDVIWIKQSPASLSLNDNEVLSGDDVRRFSSTSRVSDPSVVVARRRPSRTRRASITLSLYPSREAQGDDFDRDNNVKTDSCIDDLEAGKPRHTTFLSRGHHNRQSRIAPSTRTSILDVAKGRVTMLGFLDEKTSSRRLGFHQRSEQSNIEKMEKARLHHMRSLSSKNSIMDGFWFYISGIFYDPHVRFLVLWLIWLSCGAAIFIVTYRTKGEKNYVSRGAYEAINVGYGLYLTTPDFGESGYCFTIFHLMIGSVMISGAMAEFASYLNKVNDTDNLKAINVHQESIDNKVGIDECEEDSESKSQERNNYVSRAANWFDKKTIVTFVIRSWMNYPFHVLFVAWLLIMVISLSFRHQWTFFNSLCFSTSILSTGGFISLPDRASAFDYFLVALFAFVGVPLMALSLGMFTHYISRFGEQSALADLINAGISSEELSEMEDLEILDDDGHFDISEYIVLILLRIGALQPDLIRLTNIRFDQLQEQQNDQPREENLE